MKTLQDWLPKILSFVLLGAGWVMNRYWLAFQQAAWIPVVWYALAYLPVAWPVFKDAAKAFAQKDFFNEFSLMIIASIGAFCIGEYPEAVAVMLFYAIGEQLQDKAVERSRRNIRDLLAMHPDRVRVVRDTRTLEAKPEEVQPGEILSVAVGEKVCLDGALLDEAASLDTAALTGESLPRYIRQGEEVPAGCLVLDHAIRLKVLRPYNMSALAKMAKMVEEASKRKAPTELFLRRIARIYTPVVMGLAVLVMAVPALFSLVANYHYDFSVWLYRALVFLVVSCPCALVVSIPLTYFAGIGMASRRGILFKGGNGLDAAYKVNAIVFDKTGTLTQGRFQVRAVSAVRPGTESRLLSALASAEDDSRHPLAQAIVAYARERSVVLYHAARCKEKAGGGILAEFDARVEGNGGVDDSRGSEQDVPDFGWVAAGSASWLRECGVAMPMQEDAADRTVVFCGIDGVFSGRVELADLPKEDAISAMRELRALGIRPLAVLSGDHARVAEALASQVGVEKAYGGLLPQDKVVYLQKFRQAGYRVAFVGDGINDSPVLASSSLGIAMGKMGSDAAIETADVVLQTDSLSVLPIVFRIARDTRRTVWENVMLAFGIKILVMVLGVLGVASLWLAVFADSGVALLAVLNSVRGVWLRKK